MNASLDLLPLVRAASGLDPPAWLLEARAAERAAELALSHAAYAARLSGDAAELERLVERLRVGETRFFRHAKQLAALGERILPALPSHVKAWSAGCASGEEAWTLAIILCERGLSFSLSATDLSASAIAHAQRGRYPAARVDADVPGPLVARYFRRIGDDCVINDRLRPYVRFSARNLFAGPEGRDFDLVACRNVLIYFDEPTRAVATRRLVSALAPNGFLLLGYSEALRDVAELEPYNHATYRRRDAAPRRPPVTTLAPRRAQLEPVASGPRRVMLRGEYHDGARLAAELGGVIGGGACVVDLDGARFLGDDAARVLKRALEATPGLDVRTSRPAVRRWLSRHGLMR